MSALFSIGQSVTSPVSYMKRKEIRIPVYLDSNGYIQNAEFVHKPIVALEKGTLTRPLAIVLHRTVSTSSSSALASFNAGKGTHFLVDKDGTTYQTASLNASTQHVGNIRFRCFEEDTCGAAEKIQVAAWERIESYSSIHNHEKVKAYPARYPMNEDSVGIAVVAMWTAQNGWDPTTPAQHESIKHVIATLQSLYSLTDADVYEHDVVSRKTPGEGSGLYDGADGVPARFPPPFF